MPVFQPAADRLQLKSIDEVGLTKKGEVYGEWTRERPQDNVQIPGEIEISMIEIITFLPNAFLLPRVATRAMLAGWTPGNVAKLQLSVLNIDNKDDLNRVRNNIHKQFKYAAKECLNWQDEFDFAVIRAQHQSTWDWDLTARN